MQDMSSSFGEDGQGVVGLGLATSLPNSLKIALGIQAILPMNHNKQSWNRHKNHFCYRSDSNPVIAKQKMKSAKI